MKEIKFRAWTDNVKKGGEMYYQYVDRALSYSPLFSPAGYGLLNPSLKIMQSTGLNDMHGREIYEGDILKATVSYQDFGRGLGAVEQQMQLTGHVYSDGLGLRMSIISQSDREPVFEDGYLIDVFGDVLGPDNIEEWLKVIGNIHENPELLARK